MCIHKLSYFKTGIPQQCSVSACGYVEHQHFSIVLVFSAVVDLRLMDVLLL
jgi:hypothetical protein